MHSSKGNYWPSMTTKISSKETRPLHHTNGFRTSFQNPWPSATVPSWEELAKLSFPFSWYPSKPTHKGEIPKVKVVQPDWGASQFDAKSQYLAATWLGHAGVLVEFKNTIVKEKSTFMVFDPIFSARAGPTAYTGPSRLMKNPCQISDLPGCDVVFISHNHYDHLDLPTVLEIKKHFPAVKWIVPLGNKTWFTASGINEDDVTEMDWWESRNGFDLTTEVKETSIQDQDPFNFKITCVPAQHNSGRL